jgi:hypothetical protein
MDFQNYVNISSGNENKATFVDQAGKVFPLWGIWVRKFANKPEIDELQTGNWILETRKQEIRKKDQAIDDEKISALSWRKCIFKTISNLL